MTEPDPRLETVHDVVQAWQDGVIGHSQAMQMVGCEDLSELYSVCLTSGVSLRTTLLPDEETAAERVGTIIKSLLAHKNKKPEADETTPKQPSISLILPDTGPLITLAIADRLDLLQSIGRPIVIMDVVKEECLQSPEAPEFPRLKIWFDKNSHNQMKVAATPFLTVFKEAAGKQASGEDPEATRGMGDATISWFVANIRRFHTPEDISLVLTEDATFGDMRLGRNVHVLSTRAWLFGLEFAGLIPSATKVISEVQANGRNISRYSADKPALTKPGGRSDWIEHAKKTSNI